MSTSVQHSDPLRICPNCQALMFFTPDGQTLACDECGYRRPVKKRRRRPADIARENRPHMGIPEAQSGFRSTNARELLVRGIAAAKAGDKDEAHFYLEWVLRTGASNEEQARAWYWLSELYDDPADKRECLEHVLALEPTNGLARRSMAVLDGRLDPAEIVDPDRLQPGTAAAPELAQAEHFTCPRCDARMSYMPDGRALLCQYCHYRQEVGAGDAPVGDRPQIQAEFGMGGWEQDFVAALATARGHLAPVATRILQCQRCGVEFMLAPETLSLTCAYCNAVYVTVTAETRQINSPQALIPFATSVDDARLALRAWFKQHKIKRARVTPVTGVYVPVWSFDIGGEVKWSGLVYEEEGLAFMSSSKIVFFDDLLVPAGNKLPASLAGGLREFDLRQLVAYDARYLADWPAEWYQVALAEASLLALKQIMKELRQNPSRLTDREVINLQLGSGSLVVESFKLLLLPVWLAHYKVEGQVYDVMINGQSGAAHGTKPEGIVDKISSWLREK